MPCAGKSGAPCSAIFSCASLPSSRRGGAASPGFSRYYGLRSGSASIWETSCEVVGQRVAASAHWQPRNTLISQVLAKIPWDSTGTKAPLRRISAGNLRRSIACVSRTGGKWGPGGGGLDLTPASPLWFADWIERAHSPEDSADQKFDGNHQRQNGQPLSQEPGPVWGMNLAGEEKIACYLLAQCHDQKGDKNPRPVPPGQVTKRNSKKQSGNPGESEITDGYGRISHRQPKARGGCQQQPRWRKQGEKSLGFSSMRFHFCFRSPPISKRGAHDVKVQAPEASR